MSFLERTRDRLISDQNDLTGISALCVPQEIPVDAYEPLMIIGDYPEQEDEYAPRLFSGPAGLQLDAWIKESRFTRGRMPLLNVFRYRPLNNDWKSLFNLVSSSNTAFKGRAVRPHLQSEIHAVKQAIIDYRPEAVITLGHLALWSVLDHDMPVTRLTDRQPDHTCTVTRHSQFAKFMLFPAFHPREALGTFDSQAYVTSMRAFQAARRFLRPASFG